VSAKGNTYPNRYLARAASIISYEDLVFPDWNIDVAARLRACTPPIHHADGSEDENDENMLRAKVRCHRCSGAFTRGASMRRAIGGPGFCSRRIVSGENPPLSLRESVLFEIYAGTLPYSLAALYVDLTEYSRY
jgi:hypothetical protein